MACSQRKLDIYVKLEDGFRGPLLASGYTRLLIGGRGPYVEFEPSQINRNEIEPEPGQEYRLSEEWRQKAFYAWHRTKAGHRKVYEQYRYVGYADYVPGRFYVDPSDLVFEGELHTEVSKRVARNDELPHIDFDS